jgi:hypothetical protein
VVGLIFTFITFAQEQTLVSAEVGYQHDNLFNDPHNMRSFLVLEPNVQANLNVTHFFLIAAGISYRYVSDVKSIVTINADLSRLLTVLTLKFGIL